jgi:MoaD family protein
MIVKLFAGIRDIAGTPEVHPSGAPDTLGDLVAELSGRYGEALGAGIVEDGRLSDFVVVLVNGRNVRLDAGLATALGQDDEVSIFPLVSGG